MKISQSLIKEVLNPNHCPKQIYYSFVEGIDIKDIPAGWKMGRYFETELLGSCRGGDVQKPEMVGIKSNKPTKSSSKKAKLSYLHSKEVFDKDHLKDVDLFFEIVKMPADFTEGEKAEAYKQCDELVVFAKEVFKKLGLDIDKGESQIDVESEFLKGAIDHRNKDLLNPSIKANYDVKWTATKEDDIWNGWGNPENKEEAIIQATHYTLLSYEETGVWMPFYYLVFGKDKWVKVIQFKITPDALSEHKGKIQYTSSKVREYAENNYKGNGSFNKCLSCEFYDMCDDKSKTPEIETIII